MAEASHETVNYKTLFLKVSIHCEGCKKKVRRVLQNIEGVSKVDIDSFQHKVAVTCSVDHNTLIRKLLKSGKQASVWPEAKKPDGNQTANTSNDNKNQNKESNSKPKDKEPEESSENPKEKQPEPAKDKNSDKGDEKEKEKEKPKTEDETKSKPQEKEKDGGKEKPKEKEKEKQKEKAKEQSEQEGKQNSSGENKKEKKEEKEKKNENSAKEGGQQVEKGISPLQPKQEFMYQPYSQPYPYPYPSQPIMSYHTAQPTSSQSYYQQPPMPGTQGYMYPYPEPNPYQYQYQSQSQSQYPYGAPSEFNYGSTESNTRGEDTLSYFNEENANSCSVM